MHEAPLFDHWRFALFADDDAEVIPFDLVLPVRPGRRPLGKVGLARKDETGRALDEPAPVDQVPKPSSVS
jgi:hypothetical protein